MFKVSFKVVGEGKHYDGTQFASLDGCKDLELAVDAFSTIESVLDSRIPFNVISMHEFENNYRSKANWIQSNGLMIDIDSGTKIEDFVNQNKSYRFYLHTSKSHLVENEGIKSEKFHVFMPFDRPMTKNDIISIVINNDFDAPTLSKAIESNYTKTMPVFKTEGEKEIGLIVIAFGEQIIEKCLNNTKCEYDKNAKDLARMFFPSFESGRKRTEGFTSIYNDGIVVQWDSKEVIAEVVNHFKKIVAEYQIKLQKPVVIPIKKSGQMTYSEYLESEERMMFILEEIRYDLNNTHEKIPAANRFGLACLVYSKLGENGFSYIADMKTEDKSMTKIWNEAKAVKSDYSSDAVLRLEKWIQKNLGKNCKSDYEIDTKFAEKNTKLKMMITTNLMAQKIKYREDTLNKLKTTGSNINQTEVDSIVHVNLSDVEDEADKFMESASNMLKTSGYTDKKYATSVVLKPSGINLKEYFNSFIFYNTTTQKYYVKHKVEPGKIDSLIRVSAVPDKKLKGHITLKIIKTGKNEELMSASIETEQMKSVLLQLEQSIEEAKIKNEAKKMEALKNSEQQMNTIDLKKMVADLDSNDEIFKSLAERVSDVGERLANASKESKKPSKSSKDIASDITEVNNDYLADMQLEYTNAVGIWMNMQGRAELGTYETVMSFDPVQPLHVINTFTGYSCEPEEGDIQPYLNFINSFFTKDPVMVEFILNYMAKMVQLQKNTEILVLQGNQGSGKNTLLDLTGKLFNTGHYVIKKFSFMSNNREESYSDWLSSSVFTVVDEVVQDALEPKYNAVWESMKFWSGKKTGETMEFSKIYEGNFFGKIYSSFAMCTNYESNIKIENNDRRYVVINHFMFEIPSYEKDIVPLLEWYENGGKKHLLHFLKNYKTKNINIQTNADMITISSINGRRNSYTEVEKFIEYLILNESKYMTCLGDRNLVIKQHSKEGDTVSTTTMWMAFKEHFECNFNYKMKIDNVQFLKEFMQHSGCERIKLSGEGRYKYDIKEIRKHFSNTHKIKGVNIYDEAEKYGLL